MGAIRRRQRDDFAEQPTNRITTDAFDDVTRAAECEVCAARVAKVAARPGSSTRTPDAEISP